MNTNELHSKIDELKRKERYLDVVNSFATDLLPINTVDEIVWAIAKNAIAKLGYVDCVIYLMDDNREFLIQRAAHGAKNPKSFDIYNPIILKKGNGIAGTVASTGNPELIGDCSKEGRYVIDDDVRYSEIAVPILFDDEVIGVIDSEHPEKNYYTEDDLKILSTIASMASFKINQAITKERLENHKDELELKIQERTSELQMTIERLQKQNARNEDLLGEVHHRVKNNMQIMMSLLNLHMNEFDGNEKMFKIFGECQTRIRSMALIHELIYAEKDFSFIDLKHYITSLVTELCDSYKPGGKIKLHFDIDDFNLGIDTLLPFGLILNEAVCNSLKQVELKALTVNFKENNKGHILSIKDNGTNMETVKNTNTIGMELIDALTSQLDGKFNYNLTSEGAEFLLEF